MDQITISICEDDELERDRAFNAFRYADSPESKFLVETARKHVLNYEEHFRLRENRRRPSDQVRFDRTIEAILVDLMHHHLVEYPKAIYVTRSNKVLGTKNRYRAEAYNKQFPKILDVLASKELGYIKQHVSAPLQGAKRSTIEPGWRLLEGIAEYGITIGDFGEYRHAEVIILKSSKDPNDYWDEADRIDYEDDTTTNRYREDLAEISEWIGQADIRFDWTGIPLPHTPCSVRDRQLRRSFTHGSFESGGRLFGGFWQQLKKMERQHGLYINGERAVELDYGQIGPRILYGMVRQVPPDGDLYGMAGVSKHRDGFKKVMNAIIFASGRLERLPKGTRQYFPQGFKVAEIVELIERKHPLIADQFHKGIGHRVQFHESEIMVRVLSRLIKERIVALPIHDAVMVPTSAIELTRTVMLEAFHEVVGHQGTVSVIEPPPLPLTLREYLQGTTSL